MATVYRLPGVRLFASGVYRGRTWPPAVVAAVGSGVRQLGPRGAGLIVPPAVIGHEEPEDQDWLNRTDLEAAGWVDPSTARCEPDPDNPGHLILIGDVVNVPEEVADLVRSGKVKYGSVEVYDDFTDDFGRSRGPALRRFALLGGEVPQVKRLGPLPMPVPMAAPVAFGETTTAVRPTTRPTFLLAFAERATMNRDQAIAAIKAAMPTLTDAFFDGMPDDKVIEMASCLPAAPAPVTTPAAPMADVVPGVPAAVDPMTMTQPDLIAWLTQQGQDPAMLQGMDLQGLQDLAKSLMPGTPAPMSDANKRCATMSEPKTPAEKAAAATIARFAEMNKRLDAETKSLKTRRTAVKRELAEAFCEGLVKGERLFPWQKADYVAVLTALDDTNPVHSFTENGKTVAGLTAFARKQRELAARPKVVRFGERFPAGDGKAADASAEVNKVEKFAELNRTALKTSGTDPAKLVARAKKMAEADPDFRAESIIGKDGAAMIG